MRGDSLTLLVAWRCLQPNVGDVYFGSILVEGLLRHQVVGTIVLDLSLNVGNHFICLTAQGLSMPVLCILNSWEAPTLISLGQDSSGLVLCLSSLMECLQNIKSIVNFWISLIISQKQYLDTATEQITMNHVPPLNNIQQFLINDM